LVTNRAVTRINPATEIGPAAGGWTIFVPSFVEEPRRERLRHPPRIRQDPRNLSAHWGQRGQVLADSAPPTFV